MKLMPLARSWRSSTTDMPSWMEGVLASSSSLKIHCASASARTRFGDLGLCREAGCDAGKCWMLEGGIALYYCLCLWPDGLGSFARKFMRAGAKRLLDVGCWRNAGCWRSVMAARDAMPQAEACRVNSRRVVSVSMGHGHGSGGGEAHRCCWLPTGGSDNRTEKSAPGVCQSMAADTDVNS